VIQVDSKLKLLFVQILMPFVEQLPNDSENHQDVQLYKVIWFFDQQTLPDNLLLPKLPLELENQNILLDEFHVLIWKFQHRMFVIYFEF